MRPSALFFTPQKQLLAEGNVNANLNLNWPKATLTLTLTLTFLTLLFITETWLADAR